MTLFVKVAGAMGVDGHEEARRVEAMLHTLFDATVEGVALQLVGQSGACSTFAVRLPLTVSPVQVRA